MPLDRYDIRILEELQKDAYINNQELADRIGLTPSPCLRRVKQLEEQGVIAGRAVLLDPDLLGLKLLVLIHISMDKHIPDRFETFETAVEGYPEVLECNLITGQSADYMLKVLVSDMKNYQDFLLKKLTAIPGVSGVHSSFVLSQPVKRNGIPLHHLR
ncbi:Lrp/AsnC family transcriptional regulator [Spongorhabdus nitratireducens]